MSKSNEGKSDSSTSAFISSPKELKEKKSDKSHLINAPSSFKQQCFQTYPDNISVSAFEEPPGNDILNSCCKEFNSLLFLTPPKIRLPSSNCSPIPIQHEVNVANSTFETTLAKDLLNILSKDDEQIKKFPHNPLQNVTNRTQKVPEKDKSQKKKAGESKQFKFPEGGWVCLECENYNFQGPAKCNRCGKVKTKEDPVGKPKHMLRTENDENIPPTKSKDQKKQLRERTGDWLCVSCRNINFAFRKQCNRCKLNKELVGSTLGVPNDFQSNIWNPNQNACYSYFPNMDYNAEIPYEYQRATIMGNNNPVPTSLINN